MRSATTSRRRPDFLPSLGAVPPPVLGPGETTVRVDGAVSPGDVHVEISVVRLQVVGGIVVARQVHGHVHRPTVHPVDALRDVPGKSDASLGRKLMRERRFELPGQHRVPAPLHPLHRIPELRTRARPADQLGVDDASLRRL